MDLYDVELLLGGLLILGAAVIPRALAGRPLSMPIVYVLLGAVVFALPFGFDAPDPVNQPEATERLTELAVIISLTGAGLRLDRPVGWRSWHRTWRLLAIAMPLTIASVALLGWVALGLGPAMALLLGAVLAPTDPVLAADVQVGPPGDSDEEEDEVRFALTSEAGLNDALAFPFTNAALAAMGAASLGAWVGGWVLDDVVIKLVVGLAIGFAMGRALAWLAFRWPATGQLSKTSEGFVAIAITLVVYGTADLAHGYGFLAVFVAAVTIRNYERGHDYHQDLHDVADATERLLMSGLLVLFGGALFGGLLGPLTWQGAVVGLVIVLVVRPAAATIALLRTGSPPKELAAIAFFGIRGIGSAYYLAHAIVEVDIGRPRELWAIVGFVIVVSILLHGVTATPVMRRLQAVRESIEA